jgi:aminoglycoside phosphotransferase (APT) family kinase protein
MTTPMRAPLAAGLARPLVPQLVGLKRRWTYGRDVARAGALLPAILPTLPSPAGARPSALWRVQRAERTQSGLVVLLLGPDDAPATAVLKLAQTAEGVTGVRKQAQVLGALRADPRLGDWRGLLPDLLAEGSVGGQLYALEQALPGQSALPVLADAARCRAMQAAASAAIAQLHCRTARTVVVDDRRRERWIDRPLHMIRQVYALHPRGRRYCALLRRLQRDLQAELAGRTLPACWIHGDFWPGNVLVAADGVTLTGIVDWDRATAEELPMHDLVHLLLSTRGLVQQRDLGEIVRALLEGEQWTAHERSLLDAAERALPGSVVEERAMVLLSWLRHITGNLTKSSRYRRNVLWLSRNVDAVLRSV